MPNLSTTSTDSQQPQQHRFTLASNLATSSSPRSDLVDQTSFDSLQQSISDRALSTHPTATPALLLNHRLSLVEQLSEKLAPPTALHILRTEIDSFDEQTWSDLLEERWMEDRCPYPACEYLRKDKNGRPSIAYDPEGRAPWKLSRSGGLVVKSLERANFEPFCSKKCQNRNDYYRDLVGRRTRMRKGKGKDDVAINLPAVELLEDIEVRRQKVVDATEEDLAQAQRESASPSLGTSTATMESAPTNGLVIKENPTPTVAPTPPSLDDLNISFERPLTSSSAPRTTPRPPSTTSTTRQPPPPPPIQASLRPLLRPPSPPPAHIQPPPSIALPGLPPPRWLTGPIMINSKTGRAEEWVAEELTEEEKVWLEEGVREIKLERERERERRRREGG